MTTQLDQQDSGTSGHGLVALAGEGRVYQAMGTSTTLKADGTDTGHACEVIESVFPPGNGIPPHRHQRSDEAVYVVSGQLVVQVGERTVTAAAGSFCFIPKRTVHAMQNVSGEPCRALLWQMPGVGMRQQLEEMNALPPGPPDLTTLLPLMAKYDIEPVVG
jgi:quercetin dioxygenase-like cupin family protein